MYIHNFNYITFIICLIICLLKLQINFCVTLLFSKILKKVMHVRVYNCLYKHNILYSNQFDLRTNHLTELAVLQYVDNLTPAIDNGNYTAGIFLDLSKAFDTVDHNILLWKLSHHCIRGIAVNRSKVHTSN